MSRKLLSFILTVFVAAFVGCGGTDEINLNQFNNNAVAGGLSGQTGTVTLQTQLANNQTQNQEVLVISSDIIPSFVDELRFTGQDSSGAFIYGPVTQPKAPVIDLLGVPVEVVTLRIELLVNGFTIGGVVTPVGVPSGDTVFVTNPTYVFAGATSDVGDTVVIFGSFLNNGEGGGEFDPPEGEFGIGEAPVIDFATPQVTNGVTRIGFGEYTVTEQGDYLLSYSVDIPAIFDQLVTQLARNNAFVDNTRLDLADIENIFFQVQAQTNTATQGFQHIVTLDAGDTVSLRVRDFDFIIQGQQTQDDVFSIAGGTFSIVRLGSGGVTGGPAPQ